MSIQYENGNIKFTILEKNNKYHLDFYTPAGERKRKSTKKTVNKENLKYIKNVLIPDIVFALGQDPTINEIEKKEWTLDKYAQEYFELQKNEVSKKTLHKKKLYYYNHIYPILGERVIFSIKHNDLKLWQHKKMNEVSPLTGRKYKRGTVQIWRSVLNSILNAAVDDEIIEKNYFSKVVAPRSLKHVDKDQKENEIFPFSQAQLKQILDIAEGYMRNFILLMYATGMRPGEILALEWIDIDWNREVIHVTKTRQAGADGPPKTESSIREVEILTNAYNALKAQYLLTRDQCKVFVNPIHNENGKQKAFYGHDTISKNFKNILTQCGIKGQYLYNLRHTFASTLLSKGKDALWISRMMGHKDVSITLKTYAKFIQEDDATRIEKKREIDKDIDTF